MSERITASSPWWGAVSLDERRRWSGRLGPFEMWLNLQGGEVTIAHRHGPDPLQVGRGRASAAEPPEDAEWLRCPTSQSALELSPALADRPIVVRPEVPLRLLPGDSTELRISTPLWLRLDAGLPAHRLLDVPTFRPSDTWFGPSPREGELCYASRTRARLAAASEGLTTTRAHTLLALTNGGSDSLLVDRINLPVPRLGLYLGDGGLLWTDGLSVARQPGEELVEVSIQRGLPPRLAGARRVAEPRNPEHGNVFVRAMTSLLG